MRRLRHPARSLLGAAAAAAIVLPVGAQARTASSAEPPPNLSVGPSVEMPLDPRVFVTRTDGHTRRVTPRGMLAFDPEWNPRTGALVAVMEQGILELGLGRGGSTKGQPVWSKRVTLTSAMGWSPSFSPNGSEIALVTGSRPDVWVLGRGTGRFRRLTTDWGADGFVDWSPAGNAIAAVRFGRVFVLRTNGVLVRAISSEDGTCMLPAWSPGGGRIAFTCLSPQPGVAVTDTFGANVRVLTIGDAPTAYAAWSPDGRRIAYAKYVNGSWDLFVQELRSGRERRLTRTPYDEVDPAWSPDGRWLAFTGSERPIR